MSECRILASTMPFQLQIYRCLPAIERADAIIDRLSIAVALGLLKVGERLPPEAALSEMFGVGGATLREALGGTAAAGNRRFLSTSVSWASESFPQGIAAGPLRPTRATPKDCGPLWFQGAAVLGEFPAPFRGCGSDCQLSQAMAARSSLAAWAGSAAP
jgi:hypothetical protein